LPTLHPAEFSENALPLDRDDRFFRGYDPLSLERFNGNVREWVLS